MRGILKLHVDHPAAYLFLPSHDRFWRDAERCSAPPAGLDSGCFYGDCNHDGWVGAMLGQ